MAQLRYAMSMLVAGGCLAVTSQASATTQVFNDSDQTAANIDLAGGGDQFTIGPVAPTLSKQPFDFTPNGSSLIGVYSQDMVPTSMDTYSNAAVNTDDNTFGIYTPTFEGTSYLNLKFDTAGKSYVGTAEFTGDDTQTTLDSITYTSAAPEPSEWALLLAGVGGAGIVLRRRRQNQLSYSL